MKQHHQIIASHQRPLRQAIGRKLPLAAGRRSGIGALPKRFQIVESADLEHVKLTCHSAVAALLSSRGLVPPPKVP